MTREEVAAALGIVPNSVRGKVQKGQIERKVEGGKNYYRIVDPEALTQMDAHGTPSPEPPPTPRRVQEMPKAQPQRTGVFNPKALLLEQLASMKVGRNIEAIEKGDEIDLATDEISRELDARITMRQHRQIKEIQDALERLQHGEYGICEECGDPIPEQRLRLFPAARFCVRCQEEVDQHEKLRADTMLRGGAWKDESTESSYSKTFEE
ncbi:MAG: TraR/DksA family transcriptional regulator [Deltaproteobacteria bacterium]|nr:TraR/DksA family transcriptional regulator [Deltaproteobacteria bacterium]